VSAAWRFIVLADWHGAEGFARDTSKNTDNYKEKLNAFTFLKQNYGGEVMVLPGDTQNGKWYEKKYIQQFYKGQSPQQAVLKSGNKCYPTMVEMFAESGYKKLLVSTGDHEYGGNGWGPADPKTHANAQYRYTFGNGFNFNPVTKNFRYKTKIGNVKPFPAGTEFETTSYAVRHNNALFVTVDAFFVTGLNAHWDRQNGTGGEGVITCTVTGKHLKWFEDILKAARKSSWCKHIFVQAHLPIDQPVRKVNCSGQFFDEGTDSPFWKIMEEYNVDIYFAGEVHANTVSKSKNSNLVQIVSRGNRINNFITVDVDADKIELTQYNELADSNQASYNLNYEKFGSLTIDKSGTKTKFGSSGSLKFLNKWAPMLHYDFEVIHGIEDRQVLGLKDEDKAQNLIALEMTIRGKTVNQAIWNKGAMSEQYDAQVGGINLVKGVKGLAGQFDGGSRMGIFGVGPHGPGTAMSLSFWIKTNKTGNFIVWLYGQSFGGDESSKDAQLVTLEKGELIYHRNTKSKIVPVNNMNVADNKWHHVVFSMPKDNCAMSQVDVYIDGKATPYKVVGFDDYIFHNTSGRCSIGGFGYASNVFDKLYSNVKPYIGLIDEFKVVYGPISKRDVKREMKRVLKRR
jgi:hypothetical protein